MQRLTHSHSHASHDLLASIINPFHSLTYMFNASHKMVIFVKMVIWNLYK